MLLVSNKLAVSVCDNQEWLDFKGASSQQCLAKINSLKEACAKRIFPYMDKAYIGKGVASKLLDRYSACVGI